MAKPRKPKPPAEYEFEPISSDTEKAFGELDGMRSMIHIKRTDLNARLDHYETERDERTHTPSGERETTGFRKEIEEHVKAAGAGGLFASQVKKHFNPTKDDKLQSRINAALHNLKKQGKLRQEARNAQYVAAEHVEPTATLPPEEEPATGPAPLEEEAAAEELAPS